MPHEVIQQWDRLRVLLMPAVDAGTGELLVDDIRELVISGRMFIFASDGFALACEFINYPRKTVLNVSFGGGRVGAREAVGDVLCDFALRGGASSIQTYCKNPAMTRYYRRWFGLDPIYTVLEKQL